MKKIIGLMMTICIIATQFSVMAEDALYFNEGGITIKDSAPAVRPGEKVSLLVTPNTVDWLSEAVRAEHKGDNVVYFGSETVAKDGSYSFNFYLPKSGKYNVYITEGNEPTENGKPSRVKEIVYINKTKNTQAISELKIALGKSTASNTKPIADVLDTYSEGMGLYDLIFKDKNYDSKDTAKIAYDALSELSEYEPFSVIEIFEKSAVCDMLNDSYKDSINKYANILFDEDDSLYEEDEAESIYNYMKNKNIQNLKELDKITDEAIVITKANSGDSVKINSVLSNVFAKMYPEYSDKISLALSVKIAEKSDWTVDTLKTYIEDYSEPEQEGPSVSYGGGGGGVVSSNKNIPAVPNFKQELDSFMPFNDISNVTWAHEAIIGLYNKGCISGRDVGVFAPNDNISREEFLKILVSMFDLELVGSEELPFVDVNKEAWYFEYIKTAYLAGVTNGISNDLFGIGQNITRQDLCKMTVNLTDALGKTFEQKQNISFKDDTQIADYAKDAVYMLASAGIVSGNEVQEFNPLAKATRAEAAKILYYTMTLVK